MLPVKKQEGLGVMNDDLDNLDLGSGFGRVAYYMLFNTDTGDQEWLKNENHHFGGNVHPWVKAEQKGVDVVITPNLGSRPYEQLSKRGIKLFKAEGSIGGVIRQFKKNELTQMEEPEAGSCCSGGKHHH